MRQKYNCFKEYIIQRKHIRKSNYIIPRHEEMIAIRYANEIHRIHVLYPVLSYRVKYNCYITLRYID